MGRNTERLRSFSESSWLSLIPATDGTIAGEGDGRCVREVEVEIARYRKHGVPDGLGLKPPFRHLPAEPVLRVGVGILRMVLGRKLVGARGDEVGDELFDRPPVLHELDGEVVEQLGVRWCFAGGAEVIDGADEPSSEEVVPNAVHEGRGR